MFDTWHAAVIPVLDGVVLFMLLEMALFSCHGVRHRHGIPLEQVLPNLLAGLSLVLLARSVAQPSTYPWWLACLALSGVAHATDLWQRWLAAVKPAAPQPAAEASRPMDRSPDAGPGTAALPPRSGVAAG